MAQRTSAIQSLDSLTLKVIKPEHKQLHSTNIETQDRTAEEHYEKRFQDGEGEKEMVRGCVGKSIFPDEDALVTHPSCERHTAAHYPYQ